MTSIGSAPVICASIATLGSNRRGWPGSGRLARTMRPVARSNIARQPLQVRLDRGTGTFLLLLGALGHVEFARHGIPSCRRCPSRARCFAAAPGRDRRAEILPARPVEDPPPAFRRLSESLPFAYCLPWAVTYSARAITCALSSAKAFSPSVVNAATYHCIRRLGLEDAVVAVCGKIGIAQATDGRKTTRPYWMPSISDWPIERAFGSICGSGQGVTSSGGRRLEAETRVNRSLAMSSPDQRADRSWRP
jgi:hypothetical protein